MAQTLANGSTIDRTEASRAMAKAIAYAQCGKQADAEEWARRLVEILKCAEILK
jgi:Flp pilus assembly protein TadD